MSSETRMATGAACLVVGLAAYAGEVGPDVTPVYKTVGATTLRLHVFRPAGWTTNDARPGIVFFFGGGWSQGSPSQFYPHCRHLAARGMVAMAAEYRVASRDKTTPFECVADGKSAVRWIRQHARELGVDPARLAAGGGSAGGQVAAATALAPAFDEPVEDAAVSSRPDALVLFNPVFDNGPTGYGNDRVKARWKEFSPLHNIVTGAPPTVVFLGSKDALVPVATAERYRDRMREVGSRCDLHVYEGQEHGFFNYRGEGKNPSFDETLAEADRFLTALQYLPAPPASP